MFFNSDLLTKRGALAQVWMASHLTSKLSKSALTSTSIPKSVESILGQELLPMALRLSGQLLLGIARIYSRKTKYLLDDAQETLHKVKKAFQNEQRAAVDLPDEGAAGAGAGEGGAARGDINLRREGGDLEDLLAIEFADGEWSLEKHLAAAKEKNKGKVVAKNTTANARDITLDEDYLYGGMGNYGNDDLGLDLDDELAFDPDFQLFPDDEFNALAGVEGDQQRGVKRGREDQDDDDLSVELGRRDSVANASDRNSIGPLDLDLGLDKDLDADLAMQNDDNDMGGFDAGFQLDFDGADNFVQNEFGGGFDDEQREKTPTAPSIAGDEDAASLQLTPRAAADVAARKAAADKEKQPAKKRQKAVAIDKVIELEWQAGRLEGKNRFKEPEYLPSSRLHLALLETPLSAHLPLALNKANKNAPALELYAPPGLLAHELRDLYKLPSRREQIRLEGRERHDDREVEQGRRAASVVSNLSQIQGGANDLGDLDAFDLNQDFGGGGDEYGGGFEHDFQFDLDLPGGAEGAAAAEGEDAPATPSKKRKLDDKGKERASTEDLLATPARSVLSVLARDELPTYHSEGPLAVFDDVSAHAAASSTAGTQSQLESQATAAASQSLGTEQEAAIAGADSVVTQKSGSISLQSKNTRKAVRVLQEQVGEDKTKPVEFEKVANKASRRAAASFFFELLVLSSADVVKLNQPQAYGNIEVRATDKLQEIAV
ncbi:hypothetical protein B0A53_02349 [Rhodotorula sp. CCFEE 5036]|nr:hypothetical protein B0A53_02349 [Rhodotorula sp. CCFEE 5036]